jgi:hypothetical protein
MFSDSLAVIETSHYWFLQVRWRILCSYQCLNCICHLFSLRFTEGVYKTLVCWIQSPDLWPEHTARSFIHKVIPSRISKKCVTPYKYPLTYRRLLCKQAKLRVNVWWLGVFGSLSVSGEWDMMLLIGRAEEQAAIHWIRKIGQFWTFDAHQPRKPNLYIEFQPRNVRTR